MKEEGIKEEDIAIGFIDETSPQNTANTVRVWGFGKARVIKKHHKILKAYTIANFLKIREANTRYKAVVAIIDNFPAHKSKFIKQKVAIRYLPCLSSIIFTRAKSY